MWYCTFSSDNTVTELNGTLRRFEGAYYTLELVVNPGLIRSHPGALRPCFQADPNSTVRGIFSMGAGAAGIGIYERESNTSGGVGRSFARIQNLSKGGRRRSSAPMSHIWKGSAAVQKGSPGCRDRVQKVKLNARSTAGSSVL